MKTALVSIFVLTIGLAGPAAARQGVPAAAAPPGPLGAARDLYASARYDEALTILNTLRSSGVADVRSVEQYRSLCLLALGRASEAESAIAAVVTADPAYRPGEAEAAPRVRATFTEVRRRLLPEITMARYVAAKTTYDRREWAAASEQFRAVLALIDDPDSGGRLNDLRVLAGGFLELSARAAAPPPEPEPAPPAARPHALAPEPARGPQPGKTYSVEDAEVVHPVVVKQDIPSVPSSIVAMAKPRGIVEVIIDEQGRPVSLAIRASIHPKYDTLLLAAMRDWKYRPAKFDGTPVRYRKLIQVSVAR